MKPGSFLIPCLLVAFIVAVLITISCNKTGSGIATLSLESISSPVFAHDSMRVRFKFTNGTSISNGTLGWIRTRLNQAPAMHPSGNDTFGYQLPAYTANTGEIYLSLPWDGYLSTGSPENDTLIFRFFATNASDSLTTDTVRTPQIVVNFQ
ncbi:MAG TPA: hypothetical protein VMH27_17210 [Puia sp.]|nr:hypothetical protein [Puia sp.]